MAHKNGSPEKRRTSGRLHNTGNNNRNILQSSGLPTTREEFWANYQLQQKIQKDDHHFNPCTQPPPGYVRLIIQATGESPRRLSSSLNIVFGIEHVNVVKYRLIRLPNMSLVQVVELDIDNWLILYPTLVKQLNVYKHEDGHPWTNGWLPFHIVDDIYTGDIYTIMEPESDEKKDDNDSPCLMTMAMSNRVTESKIDHIKKSCILPLTPSSIDDIRVLLLQISLNQ
jgi:hypothetical protein